MLASLFAAFWFAVWVWYSISIIAQQHVNGLAGGWLITIVTVLALVVSVIPILVLVA